QASTPEIQNEAVGFKEAFKSRDFWHLSIAETVRMMIVMAVITHV
ncbi:unnamed protein product, partial [marine sediment metagenome]